MSAVEGEGSEESVTAPSLDSSSVEQPARQDPAEGADGPGAEGLTGTDPDDDANAGADSARDDVDHVEPAPEPPTAGEAATVPEPPEYLRFDCTTGDPDDVAAATEAARLAVERGECIVLPTDTVYGVGADAFSAEAVQRLLDAKIRGRDMPPPVLIADPSLIRVLAVDVPQTAKDLVARHWPGPLTVICRAQPSLRLDLGETEGTIALRVPDHELAREVLRQTGPMAVSSANISGLPAALTCDEAVEQLDDRVSVYLDGGTLGTTGTAASTIVDFSQTDGGQVLRHGALTVAVLRETLPDLEDLVEPEDSLEPQDSLESGGGQQGGGVEPDDAVVDEPDDAVVDDDDEPERTPTEADATEDDHADVVDDADADDTEIFEQEEFYIEDADEAAPDRRISASDINRRAHPGG